MAQFSVTELDEDQHYLTCENPRCDAVAEVILTQEQHDDGEHWALCADCATKQAESLVTWVAAGGGPHDDGI